LAALIGLVAVACSGSAESPESTEGPIEVVVTTSILGDITGNVLRGDGTIEVLIPAGTDPHDYQASARQIADLQRADLVVANGIGLEEGMIDVLDAARSDGVNILIVGDALDPLPFHGAAEGTAPDPHIWLDLDRVATAARLIAERLAMLDGDVDWLTRAEAFAEELVEADVAVRTTLASVIESRRMLVTNHDSLGYFASRYDFEIIGTVIPGGSTLAAPRSSELGRLVAIILDEELPAVFTEAGEPDGLARSVADEAGPTVAVVELFTGSLGPPGSGADTVIGMMTTNAERIAGALS
jgi:zinc/manganese transport system substrate-binding protein